MRFIVVAHVVLAVTLLLLLYVGLSTDGVQQHIRSFAGDELSRLLGEEVTIGRVTISPPNSVVLRDVTVGDILTARRLGAGIDLAQLLRGEVRVTYAEFIGARGSVWRDSADAPLNIAPIIERLKGKNGGEKPRITVSVNNIVIRGLDLTYDILDRPAPQPGRFDPAHIHVSDIQADVTIPRIAGDTVEVDLRRLTARERSGLAITGLQGHLLAAGGTFTLTNASLALPNTLLLPADITFSATHIPVELREGTHITPADLAPLLPQLADLDTRYDLTLRGEYSARNVTVSSLALSSTGLSLTLRGAAQGLGTDTLDATVAPLRLHATAAELATLAGAFAPLPQQALTALQGAAYADLDLVATLRNGRAAADATLTTDAGVLDLDAQYSLKQRALHATVGSDGLQPARLLPELHEMPRADLDIAADLRFTPSGTLHSAAAEGALRNLEYRGYGYEPLTFDATFAPGLATLSAQADDPAAAFTLTAEAALAGNTLAALDADLALERLEPHRLALTDRYEGYTLSGALASRLKGNNADNLTGSVSLTGLDFTDGNNPLHISNVDILSEIDSTAMRRVTLRSDILRADIGGRFTPTALPAMLRELVAQTNPELLSPYPMPTAYAGTDSLRATVAIPPSNALLRFLNTPVQPLDTVHLAAALNGTDLSAMLSLRAPYLGQGNKLIEHTRLDAHASGTSRNAALHLSTRMPAKGGTVDLRLDTTGEQGEYATALSWLSATGAHHGDVHFDTRFSRRATDEGFPLVTEVAFRPGSIAFSDTPWTLEPARIEVCDGTIDISRLTLHNDSQRLAIAGRVAATPDETLHVQLRNIDLDYVFSTLAIPNVTFGGIATGDISATQLLSAEPHIATDNLHVKALSYNAAVFGDADITSAWLSDSKSIMLDAAIRGRHGSRPTRVDGTITPVGELLNLHFDADSIPAAFLQPFMAAFCDSVGGYASGNVRLYGTFKDVDLAGRAVAHDLALKISMTGTSYHTSDSVTITPGAIALRDVTIRDRYGRRATLNGQLTHSFFRQPVFNFRITDADGLFCYDVRRGAGYPWWGRVFANGTVAISGRPGHVGINVDATTAAGTEFTFELSDTQEAAEGTFITFRDLTPRTLPADTLPAAVLALKNARNDEEASPTAYDLTFNINVTPQASLNLIMDPKGGDAIRARGNGTVRMHYTMPGDELTMHGRYVLERGTYNFTLQDIILKDFVIEQGSSVTFNGDPYNVQLDIRAYYATNANLSDLDESFLRDRELTRTNVPVHAMLLITGPMQRPDIAFDLEFPTLQEDMYRKVRSIVSTDEMMSRQIIYLLTLNRFYTPEYVSATRGNELVSVASSTISSRLSSVLGQLTDKVSIAPTFRSDRGDFSDVEVDVALSSQLLNNRLLLNGTFGYRDKSLNNNSFIGDFDIEYLLNRAGSIRLKAYNRYNDQNYYLKSALTTQGVGVSFKRDFDDVFEFLRPVRRWFRRRESVPADTIPEQTSIPSIPEQ